MKDSQYKLKTAANALNRLISNSKAGENPCKIIASVGGGDNISDSEYGVIVAVYRAFGLLLDRLDAVETEQLASNK